MVNISADMVEAAVLSMVGGSVDRFPSVSLSRSGGIDEWRKIMRDALEAALKPSRVQDETARLRSALETICERADNDPEARAYELQAIARDAIS